MEILCVVYDNHFDAAHKSWWSHVEYTQIDGVEVQEGVRSQCRIVGLVMQRGSENGIEKMAQVMAHAIRNHGS